jgi:metallo-beta-lactamase family protein
VTLDGKSYPIKAKVHDLAGYSAHADQRNLLNFVRRMRQAPGEVVLVHGEEKAKRALCAKLRGIGVSCVG